MLGDIQEKQNKVEVKHKSQIEHAIKRILNALGEDVKRDGLVETPTRVAKAMGEWFGGYHQDESKPLSKQFDDETSNYDGIVLVDNITFFSHCEHHMAPFFGKVHIAYIPRDGKIVGLSKFSRLVNIFSRRLQVQERLTEQIANQIQEQLNPIGVAVFIDAIHFCMLSRGVKDQTSSTKTSLLLGAFKETAAARYELLELLKMNKVALR